MEQLLEGMKKSLGMPSGKKGETEKTEYRCYISCLGEDIELFGSI